jgi:hypothetical protein
MGSNSNRGETRDEMLNRFATKVRSTRDIGSEFQSATGAEIRGKLGIEKGNQFIEDMRKYK